MLIRAEGCKRDCRKAATCGKSSSRCSIGFGGTMSARGVLAQSAHRYACAITPVNDGTMVDKPARSVGVFDGVEWRVTVFVSDVYVTT